MHLLRVVLRLAAHPPVMVYQILGRECNILGFPKEAEVYYKAAAKLLPVFVHDPDFDPLGR